MRSQAVLVGAAVGLALVALLIPWALVKIAVLALVALGLIIAVLVRG